MSDRSQVSLYVRGFPFQTKEEDLRSLFEQFGEIKDVYLPRDYFTKKPRGFAYIQYVYQQNINNGADLQA